MADTRGQSNSLDQLERDAERTRADLAHTVEELRSRVSPDALKRDVKDYVNRTSHRLLEDIERKARENPLQALAVGAGLAYPVWRILRSIPAPILLIGAGLALSRQSSGSGGAYRSGYGAGYGAGGSGGSVEQNLLNQGREKLDAARASLSDTAQQARAAVSDRAQQASAAVQGAVQSTADKASDTLGQVRSAVSSRVDAVTSTVSGAASSAADTASRLASDVAAGVSGAAASSYQGVVDAASYASEQAVRAGQQTRETFLQTLDRNPLLVGGIGLAIGALIAAAIPVTRQENRLLGETSDEMKRRARELASEGYEAAKDAAEQLYEDTARHAREQGLSADALRESVEELGQKVRTVADRTAAAVSGGERSANSGGAGAQQKR